MIWVTMSLFLMQEDMEKRRDYIGFGWPERKDYVQWINKVLENNGKSQEIVLYGVSMGAATVMMTSGENYQIM